MVAFSSLAVATMIWSAESSLKGCGRDVERYATVGDKGTRRSFGMSRASEIHSSGLQEMPSLPFSRSLLNSHVEIAERRSSSYRFGSEIRERTASDSFSGFMFHQTQVCVSRIYFICMHSTCLHREVRRYRSQTLKPRTVFQA